MSNSIKTISRKDLEQAIRTVDTLISQKSMRIGSRTRLSEIKGDRKDIDLLLSQIESLKDAKKQLELESNKIVVNVLPPLSAGDC